jgi:hypothetical protein
MQLWVTSLHNNENGSSNRRKLHWNAENPVEMTEKPTASCEKPLKMKYDIVLG